jgi:RNA polymerase sigma-70 factor (ECF subfamily)
MSEEGQPRASRPGEMPADWGSAPAGTLEGAGETGPAAYALLDDTTLIERAKVEPDAFGALYERHVRSVFAFAYSKLRDGAAAEDVTSQTFLQALRALPRYQQRGVPIRSWLFRICANLIADRHRVPIAETPLRRSGGLDRDNEAGEHHDPPDPRAEADIAAWEQAEDFARLIADLTPEQRTVVRLRFADGLPIAEIAAQMARSEGAVKMLLMRALQNLRRRMQMGAADAG